MLKNYIVSHKEFDEFESNFSSTMWVGEIGLKIQIMIGERVPFHVEIQNLQN